MSTKQEQTRLIVTLSFLAVFIVVVLVQYASIMLFAPDAPVTEKAALVERGPILDRKGRLLAVQSTVYSLEVWKPSLGDTAQAAQFLASLSGLEPEWIRERLATGEGALVLKRGITAETAESMQTKISESKLRGISLLKEHSRYYPNGSQAAHLIGMTGVDNRGLEGIERQYDTDLHGGGGKAVDGTLYGNQVVLSLDLDIQNKLEVLADKAMLENKPDGLVFLVANAKNAEILAMVNRPGYDPNNYRLSSPEERRNRAVAYIYEPGSVFKVFTMAGILNYGTISGNTIFKTAGGFRSQRFRDPITDLTNYGDITVEGIITYSSNVGAALAAETVSDETFHQILQSFGFGSKTELEIGGEEKGILKNPENWSARTKPTLAFGQELAVSAIQMLQAATAIANEGILLKPHVVKQIMSPQGEILSETRRTEIRRVTDPASANAMLTYMNNATEEGTAKRSKVQGVNISVKTGTSQMIDPKTGSYSKDAFIASSLAIFPSEAPEVIVYMVIFHPRGESTYGGRIVAPIIKESAEFLVPYLGIKREGDIVHVQDPGLQVRIPQLPVLDTQVPDFTGLPLRVLMPLLSQRRYQISFEGSGWVQSQSPAPGTPLEDGMRIHLTLGEQQ